MEALRYWTYRPADMWSESRRAVWKRVHSYVQTPEYSKVEYPVNVATRLPRDARLTPRLPTGDGLSEEFVFEGDQDVSGVRLPRRVKGIGDVSFILNPSIDPRLFTTAPDGVASRDAWRKWLVQK